MLAALVSAVMIGGTMLSANAAPTGPRIELLNLSDEVIVVRGYEFPSEAAVSITSLVDSTSSYSSTKSTADGRFAGTVVLPVKFAGVVSVSATAGTVSASASLTVGSARGTATLSSRTFSTTWKWTGETFPNYTTPSGNQVVSVVASGLTSKDRNAAAILRYSSDTDLLRVKVSATEIALEDGAKILQTVPRPGAASVTSGALVASATGRVITVQWNGETALTHNLSADQAGRRCGVQVWQDVANSVKVSATCNGSGAVPPSSPGSSTTIVAPAPVPSSTTTTSRPSVPTTAAPTPPPSSPGDKTPGWLSGSAGPDSLTPAFASWRGNANEIGGTWINDPALYTLVPGGELANFNGPVDVGVSPPTWSGWQAEANGVHDDFYRQVFTNLKKTRAGKGTVYVRPWYEFNGNWMTYSVAPGQEAVFKQAWIRMAGIARAAFPEVKLVYCASAANGINVYSAFPGKQYVDVGGIDFYNNYPFVTTQSGFDDKIQNGGGAYSMEKLRLFYKAQGIPFAVNEWSNQGARRSVGEGGGGESPQFIRSIHDYFKTHAGTGPGQLLYEVHFNLWPDQFQFYPAGKTVQPQTAAEYARLF